MKTKKLNPSNLIVKSFVTDMNKDNSNTIKGGFSGGPVNS